ncbi:MAG TPA: DUF1292 domain-containing protein [Clostridiales bacterium]|nr:DUF1292 domain-containing protein [Clostridiales bacterium]
MEERDILVFTDDEGQEIELEILDYFEYDGEEYALLVEADETEHDHDHHHDGECCHDEVKDVYIMKVIVDGETEEFVPVDEEKMDELINVIQEMYEEDADEDYDDEDYDDSEDEEDEE